MKKTFPQTTKWSFSLKKEFSAYSAHKTHSNDLVKKVQFDLNIKSCFWFVSSCVCIENARGNALKNLVFIKARVDKILGTLGMKKKIDKYWIWRSPLESKSVPFLSSMQFWNMQRILISNTFNFWRTYEVFVSILENF